jgi:hypothetical protein
LLLLAHQRYASSSHLSLASSAGAPLVRQQWLN